MHKLDIDLDKSTNKHSISMWNILLWILLGIYLLFVFYLTLFAWNYGSSYGPVGPGGRHYNLVLFRSIYNITMYSGNWEQPLRILGGNVLMFIPFGILTSLLMKEGVKTVVTVTFFSFLLSFFIEMNQFIFTYRVANVDDLLLNTIGGLLGALLIFFCRYLKP